MSIGSKALEHFTFFKQAEIRKCVGLSKDNAENLFDVPTVNKGVMKTILHSKTSTKSAITSQTVIFEGVLEKSSHLKGVTGPNTFGTPV